MWPSVGLAVAEDDIVLELVTETELEELESEELRLDEVLEEVVDRLLLLEITDEDDSIDDEEGLEELVDWLLLLETADEDDSTDDEDRTEEVVDLLLLLSTDDVDEDADDEVEEIGFELEVLEIVEEELVELGSIDGTEENEELDVETTGVSWYISSRFPAPQYSRLFPGHKKLHEAMFCKTDPVLIELPQ